MCYLLICLKHNLLSISQLCDMENKVTFYPKNYFVSSLDKDKVIFSGERVDMSMLLI